jgi:hypothetical protein
MPSCEVNYFFLTWKNYLGDDNISNKKKRNLSQVNDLFTLALKSIVH